MRRLRNAEGTHYHRFVCGLPELAVLLRFGRSDTHRGDDTRHAQTVSVSQDAVVGSYTACISAWSCRAIGMITVSALPEFMQATANLDAFTIRSCVPRPGVLASSCFTHRCTSDLFGRSSSPSLLSSRSTSSLHNLVVAAPVRPSCAPALLRL